MKRALPCFLFLTACDGSHDAGAPDRGGFAVVPCSEAPTTPVLDGGLPDEVAAQLERLAAYEKEAHTYRLSCGDGTTSNLTVQVADVRLRQVVHVKNLECSAGFLGSAVFTTSPLVLTDGTEIELSGTSGKVQVLTPDFEEDIEFEARISLSNSTWQAATLQVVLVKNGGTYGQHAGIHMRSHRLLPLGGLTRRPRPTLGA